MCIYVMEHATPPSRGTTRQMIETLLEDLRKQAAETSNQRRSDRHAIQAPLTLGVMLGQSYRPLYQAWGTDFSREGVGLLSEHELPGGMTLALNIEALLGRPCILSARVVYCKKLLPHTYRLGMALLLED